MSFLLINNYDFENVGADSFLKIKELLVKYSPQKSNTPYCIESFSINNDGEKITVNYYTSKKLMFQSNPDSEWFHKTVAEIVATSGIKIIVKKEADNITILNESNITKKWFIGVDESGTGESFGSMFLGCACISKDDIDDLKSFVGKKDIKRMEHIAIHNLMNDVRDKFGHKVGFYVKTFTAQTIDDHSKNKLLDKGYCELISKIEVPPEDLCIIVDDYGIGYELQQLLNKYKANGSLIIVQSKADEHYISCMLGSLKARHSRLNEMEYLSKENILIDPDSGNKVVFVTGSASNIEVENWIRTYRRLCPYSDFPYFVRRKWKNIQELDNKYPKQKSEIFFDCKICNNKTNKLMLYVDTDKKSKIFCSLCLKEISLENFKKIIPSNIIVVDSSVILSRAISKDLASTQYLKNVKLLIPSCVYEEVDRKSPDTKKGGQKEIEYLNNSAGSGIISVEDEDVDHYQDVQNDKKFIYVLKKHNAIILTKDANMATFSQIGHAVIELIQDEKKLKIK